MLVATRTSLFFLTLLFLIHGFSPVGLAQISLCAPVAVCELEIQTRDNDVTLVVNSQHEQLFGRLQVSAVGVAVSWQPNEQPSSVRRGLLEVVLARGVEKLRSPLEEVPIVSCWPPA